MPGGEKLPRCPKGEIRDKKTKKCVKKEKKPSPKKNNTRKVSPVKNTPRKSNSSSSSNKSAISVPQLAKLNKNINAHKYHIDYFKEFIIRLLKENESFRYRGSGDSFLYYMFDDVNNFIEKEINNIKKTSKAGGYTFGPDSKKIVLDQLNKYHKYFKDVSGEAEVMVKQIDIEKLYK